MKRYIPLDMQAIQENDLKITHWILLENIHFLSNNDMGWCFASRKSLAEWLGITDRGLQKILVKLEDENYIKIHQKTRHIKTTEKWVKMQECKNATGVNKVPVRGEQSSGKGVNKVPVLPIKNEFEGREEERSTTGNSKFSFKSYMDVLDYLEDLGWKANKIKVDFEDIKVGVSKSGKAYNLTSLNDLPRKQETRFLKYLMLNTKYLEV